ncbi:MAG: cell envelope integrity protein CreD [Lysobacteraceae bacterium]|nr:MAG: cell envelope integrity protein CreD [Xanthomonadaceae bacterium]
MRLLLKIIMVIGLTIAILVPLMMIRGTIQERQMYRTQAVHAIARTSAGAQSLSGPVLVVPYVETVEVEEKDDKGRVNRKVKQDGGSGAWTFFPNTMEMTGAIEPKSKFIGLHEVRGYELDSKTLASFRVQIPVDADPNLPRKIGRPWLSYGIADVRGLAGVPKLRIDGKEMKLERGLGSRDGSGLHVRLGQVQAGEEIALRAEFDFALEGTETLAITPLGQRNRVVLDSPWRHPQFNGSFTARKRSIGDKGFHAEWEVSSLATNAQAQYLGGKLLPDVSAIGFAAAADGGQDTGIDAISVSLVDPVNIYSQADRASKYGILFVLLTFVGFFMFELIKQLRIHPIQYGLVGLALAIFFLLLVALSEHIDFGLAYLAASAACIGLLGYYVSHVLRSWARGLGFAAMLATLYAVLYGLLISEDNAMVLGAGMLFLILAAIMVITRKVDWYSLGNAPARQGPPPTPAGH